MPKDHDPNNGIVDLDKYRVRPINKGHDVGQGQDNVSSHDLKGIVGPSPNDEHRTMPQSMSVIPDARDDPAQYAAVGSCLFRVP